MKKHIYNARGDTLLEVVDDTPECGEDFCDRCGDCLNCTGDKCYPRGDGDDGYSSHFWVVYQEEIEERS